MAKTFDPKCYELAEYFLDGETLINTEAAKITLAVEIQQCIESEIEFMLRAMKPSDEQAQALTKRAV